MQTIICRQQKSSYFTTQMSCVIVVALYSVVLGWQLVYASFHNFVGHKQLELLQISKTRVVQNIEDLTDGLTRWSIDQICTCRFADLNAFWIQNAFFSKGGGVVVD